MFSLVAQPDALEDVGDEPVEVGLVAPEVARAEEQLLADRPREQHLAWALEDVAEDRGERRDGPLGGRPAIDDDDPAVGRMRPIATLKSVVLPEPFGPSTATVSARPSDAVTPLRIWRSA